VIHRIRKRGKHRVCRRRSTKNPDCLTKGGLKDRSLSTNLSHLIKGRMRDENLVEAKERIRKKIKNVLGSYKK